MAMHFTLRQLQIFEAVARHLSFTRAAEELHLTQPAVSMQVRQLEGQVGAPLIEHLGKRIRLTEAGDEIRRCATAVAARLDATAQRIDVLRGGHGGHLRLSIASTVNYFAPRLLAEFCRQYPAVQVTLDVTNRESLLRQLADGSAEVVLMGRPPPRQGLESTPFMDNPLLPIAAPGHALSGQRRITLAQFESQTFVSREPGSGTRRAFERFCAEHHLGIQPSIEMSSNEAIKQSVEAGLGIAVVSRHTIELELAAGRLVVLEVAHFPILRRWHMVHRGGRQLSPVARTFERYVLDNAVRLGGARSTAGRRRRAGS